LPFGETPSVAALHPYFASGETGLAPTGLGPQAAIFSSGKHPLSLRSGPQAAIFPAGKHPYLARGQTGLAL